MAEVDRQRNLARRIKRTIERLRAFDAAKVSGDHDPHVKVFDDMVDRLVREADAIRGVATEQSFNRLYLGTSNDRPASTFDRARSATIYFLEAMLIPLEDEDADSIQTDSGPPRPDSPAALPTSPSQPVSPPPTVVASNKVFVVHGQNNEARAEVSDFLRRLRLDPIVLHEQPNGGRTVIEKFEQNSDVNFVVVLLTGDDIGGPKGGPQRPRARQNVVLELGYFIGYFRSRVRVCVLKRGDVEEPSELHGIIYTDMDGAGGWKLKLATELKHAGVKFDPALVF